jgi:hypothetical protein
MDQGFSLELQHQGVREVGKNLRWEWEQKVLEAESRKGFQVEGATDRTGCC